MAVDRFKRRLSAGLGDPSVLARLGERASGGTSSTCRSCSGYAWALALMLVTALAMLDFFNRKGWW